MKIGGGLIKISDDWNERQPGKRESEIYEIEFFQYFEIKIEYYKQKVFLNVLIKVSCSMKRIN